MVVFYLTQQNEVRGSWTDGNVHRWKWRWRIDFKTICSAHESVTCTFAFFKHIMSFFSFLSSFSFIILTIIFLLIFTYNLFLDLNSSILAHGNKNFILLIIFDMNNRPLMIKKPSFKFSSFYAIYPNFSFLIPNDNFLQRLKILKESNLDILSVEFTINIFNNSFSHINDSDVFFCEYYNLFWRVITLNPKRNNFIFIIDAFLNLSFLIKLDKIDPGPKHTNFA